LSPGVPASVGTLIEVAAPAGAVVAVVTAVLPAIGVNVGSAGMIVGVGPACAYVWVVAEASSMINANAPKVANKAIFRVVIVCFKEGCSSPLQDSIEQNVTAG